MKTYQILLLDKVNQEIEKVKNFQGTLKELKNELLTLQNSYCTDNKKPVYFEKVNKNKINIAIAESSADYCYIAPLNIAAPEKL